MTAYSLWEEDEINELKNLYLSSTPIKIIAKQMNRTPTSINKALSRFGIRKSKAQKKITTSCKNLQRNH